MKNWPHPKLKGKIEKIEVEFPSLKGNRLKDPWVRSIIVYSPHENDSKLPVIILLPPFLGTSSGALNQDPLSKNLFEQVDALILKGVPPFLLVIPDGFTSYGGSQYLNSPAIGNYETMIVRDLVYWIQTKFNFSPPFGLMGRSSGGYGAVTLGMKYPDLFSAAACHSGDLYFEWCYKRDFPAAYEVLKKYPSISAFLREFWKKEKPDSRDFTTLNVIAMSACYSPNLNSPLKFDLPFDLKTSELRRDIWKKWLNHDPVFGVEKFKENLKKLKLLFLDCGNKDEYFLHLGARIFTEKLKNSKISYHYEEYSDGHRGTGYRFSASIPLLVKALLKSKAEKT